MHLPIKVPQMSKTRVLQYWTIGFHTSRFSNYLRGSIKTVNTFKWTQCSGWKFWLGAHQGCQSRGWWSQSATKLCHNVMPDYSQRLYLRTQTKHVHVCNVLEYWTIGIQSFKILSTAQTISQTVNIIKLREYMYWRHVGWAVQLVSQGCRTMASQHLWTMIYEGELS